MKKGFLITFLLTTFIALSTNTAQNPHNKGYKRGKNKRYHQQYDLSKLTQITITGKVIADYNGRRPIYLLDTNSDGKGDYILNYWYANGNKQANINSLPKDGEEIFVKGYITKRKYKKYYNNIDSVIIINNNLTE